MVTEKLKSAGAARRDAVDARLQALERTMARLATVVEYQQKAIEIMAAEVARLGQQPLILRPGGGVQ